MSPAAGPLIVFRGVSKSYREGDQVHPVLRSIDAELERGQITILLGRSGSGKSTLLNLLAGIDLPDHGEVEVDGTVLNRLSERQRTLFRRRRIGFVFQFFNLIPTLTVAENLRLPLELNGLGGAESRIAELLDAVGLGPRAGSFPDRLSGGERQRVAIARALVHDPELILADEPTGNLDLDTGIQVLELLDRLTRQAGKTMVMATHSRRVVGVADRILRIEGGKLGSGNRVSRTLLLAGLRDWRRHPWQTVLAVVGVALGVAVVVAVDLANGSALRAFELATSAVTGRATHSLVGDSTGLPEGLYTRLRIDHGIRPSAPVVEGLVEITGSGARRLRLLGLDPFADGEFRTYLPRAGAGIDLARLMTRPGAVLLTSGTASELGVGPGDELAIEAGGRPARVWLAATVEPGEAGTRSAVSDLMLADLATAQELLGLTGRLSRIDLILPPGTAGEAPARRLRALLASGVYLQAAAARGEGAAAMTRAFRLNLTALSLLALLCGAFLIYNTISFGVVRRRRLLGTLRCLGASRRQLMALLISEAAVIGAAGTLVGLAAGQALGRQLLVLVTQTINDLYFVLNVRQVDAGLASLARGALLGLGASVLAALPPAIEAMAVPPRAALGRSELESNARRALSWSIAAGLVLVAAGVLLLRPRWGLAAGFGGLFAVLVGAASLTPAAAVGVGRLLAPAAGALFGQLGRITARGVEATLSRTAVAVAALTMAVAVAVGVDLMISSFRTTVVRWLEISLPADLYISLYSTPGRRFAAPDSLPPAVVAELRELPGVDGINTLRHLELAGPGGPLRALVAELDRRSFDAFVLRQGRADEVWPAFQDGRAVLVSEPLAYRRELALGDPFRLPTPAGEIELPVAGIYADYASDQGAVMVDRSIYDRYWGDGAVTAVSLYAAPGQQLEPLAASVRRLLAAAPRAEVRSSRQLRQESLRVFDRTFLITGVLRLLALAVAGVGVLSALMALQLDRARELGVLRALGLTPGQLWAVVGSQTALLGLVAGLLAMPLGWAMAAIMIRVINRRSFGWTVEMLTPPGPFLTALVLAVGAALVAGVYPAWKMSRTAPAEALREE